jgi:hypothetical protein
VGRTKTRAGVADGTTATIGAIHGNEERDEQIEKEQKKQ